MESAAPTQTGDIPMKPSGGVFSPQTIQRIVVQLSSAPLEQAKAYTQDVSSQQDVHSQRLG